MAYGTAFTGWRGVNTSNAAALPEERAANSSQRALPSKAVPPKSSATVKTPLVTATGVSD
jgi:hypothetical protein